MKLLADIQAAAVDSSVPLTDVLRRAKLLAARLGNRQFADWIEHELNGYPDDVALPPYRLLRGVGSRGNFVNRFEQARGIPIPFAAIPQDLHELIGTTPLRAGVSGYTELLKGSPDIGVARLHWPANCVAILGSQIFQGMQCLDAWQEIPLGAISNLQDAVRNRILDFALAIEKEMPADAPDAPVGAPILPADRISQIFNTYISGTGTNVAMSSHEFSQTIAQPAIAGDMAALKRNLNAAGVVDADLTELEEALKVDPPPKDASRLGGRVSSWMGKMVGKAASGAWKVSTDVAAKVVTQALLAYYGLPPT